jgi:predicted ATPase
LKLLLIEEPETAVHPGLLSKLLAEIDAYSGDRPIVLSPQSPHWFTS